METVEERRILVDRPALITGVGGPAGKAAAQFFGGKGYRVHGTDIVPTETETDEFSIVPRGDNPEFADAILAIVHRAHPCLFLCTVTEEIPAAAALKEVLRSMGVSVFATDPGMACIANDKYLTARFLFAQGIAAPRTFSDLECASAREAGERLGYPFIAKPRHGRGGRGVVVVNDPAAAEREVRSDVAYQEFLGGEEYDVNLFAYPAGEAVVTRVLLKTGLKEGIVGNATGVRIACRPDIEALAEETARAMQLEGPIDMDIRLTESGVPKVIEVNARVGANVLQAGPILDQFLHASFTGVLS